MAIELSQEARFLEFDSPLGKDLLLVSRFTGQEHVSSLFRFEIELVADRANLPEVAAEELLGKPVSISLALDEDFRNGSRRYFSGIVSRFVQGRQDDRFVHFHAEVVPWLWLTTLAGDCRIFQDVTVVDVVKQLFDELKSDAPGIVEYRDATKETYTKRDYCVQYRETTFEFISRLLEEEGLFYFFEHEDGKHTLVLADDSGAHQDCPTESEFRYRPGDAARQEERVVTDWRVQHRLGTGSVATRDYHFQNPRTRFSSTIPTVNKLGANDKLQRYDFPGRFSQQFNKPDQRLEQIGPEGDGLARVWMESEETAFQEITGESTCWTFGAGFRFDLEQHYDDRQNGKYVLTTVEHFAIQTPFYYSEDSADQQDEAYRNRFVCIPSRVKYRPPRNTPKPVVKGLHTAVVVGPEGELVYPDKYGRVKVQFFWDREGNLDDKSSCWVRVSQSWAGSGYGSMYLPHIGQEVVVGFLEGDPDQPLITGRVYNADQKVPFELPDNKYVSVIARDHYGNEIIFDGTEGNEHIRIHSPSHNSTFELGKSAKSTTYSNTDTFSVGNDTVTAIGSSQSLRVGDSHSQFLGLQTSVFIGLGLSVACGATMGLSVSAKADFNFGGSAGMNLGWKYSFTKGPEVAHGSSSFTKTVKKDITLDADGEFELRAGESNHAIVKATSDELTLDWGADSRRQLSAGAMEKVLGLTVAGLGVGALLAGGATEAGANAVKARTEISDDDKQKLEDDLAYAQKLYDDAVKTRDEAKSQGKSKEEIDYAEGMVRVRKANLDKAQAAKDVYDEFASGFEPHSQATAISTFSVGATAVAAGAVLAAVGFYRARKAKKTADKAAATARVTKSKVTLSDDGVEISSADGNSVIEIDATSGDINIHNVYGKGLIKIFSKGEVNIDSKARITLQSPKVLCTKGSFDAKGLQVYP